MLIIKNKSDVTRLRRLALDAQGLLKTQAFGRGLDGTRNAINHIGYVQIDTISVVERAHNHILYSRVPKFKPSMLNDLLTNKEIFEFWSHAAAFLPIADFRFSLPYKSAIKSGQTHWYKNPDKKLMKELLARIRAEGPLRSRDLETSAAKGAGWWDWKPAKKAIEQLYMQGDLMVSSREGFQKAYDLTERVLPANTNFHTPSINEFASHLIDQQIRCHGLISLKGVSYKRRNTELRKKVKHLITEKLAQGELEQIQLLNGETYFIPSGALDSSPSWFNRRMSILSPFDNCLIQRDRLKALFQYDYQIECYVPAAKRQFGYFSLPLLYGDAFIGRMDAKAHRKDRHLEIKALYFNQSHFDQEQIIKAFVKEMKQFCKFQKCDSVSLTNSQPKHLMKPLQKALIEIV